MSATGIPTWLEDVRAALLRGQHVLAHGNIADQFSVKDGYVDLRGALFMLLAADGFESVAVYDLADGFTHASPEDAQRFDAIYRELAGAHGSGNGGGRRSLREPLDALTMTRGVLRRPQTAAIVLDRADLLLAADHSDESRRAIALLARTIREAALTTSGQTPRRNALVLTAATLTPPLSALLRAEPLLVAVEISSPTLEERRNFVRRCAPAFHGGGVAADAPDLERRVDATARLTSGFTLWDLEALRRTSHSERIGLEDPHQLVMRHSRSRRESPWTQLQGQVLRDAVDTLGRDVIGQDHVLEQVARKLVAGRFGAGTDRDSARRERRPRLKMFFVGPTGTGKTELCKAVARLIFGDESALVTFDMGEYQSAASVGRLTGSDPGFVGYEQGGQLVNSVLRRPHCVLLFDEIEKAHRGVLDVFLAILDEGRLTDGQGRTADFRDTIIVFTSNAGASTIAELQRSGELLARDAVVEHFQTAVRERFSLPEEVGGINRPELYGRLRSAVLAFDVLRPEVTAAITMKIVRQWQENVARIHAIRIELEPNATIAAVGRHVGLQALASGARPIEDAVKEVLDEPLALWLVDHAPTVGSTLYIRFDDAGHALVHA